MNLHFSNKLVSAKIGANNDGVVNKTICAQVMFEMQKKTEKRNGTGNQRNVKKRRRERNEQYLT